MISIGRISRAQFRRGSRLSGRVSAQCAPKPKGGRPEGGINAALLCLHVSSRTRRTHGAGRSTSLRAVADQHRLLDHTRPFAGVPRQEAHQVRPGAAGREATAQSGHHVTPARSGSIAAHQRRQRQVPFVTAPAAPDHQMTGPQLAY